ncbi:hypothetical protein [Alloalcanivorax marinus]|uniref:hypothetical protein n=1 Tax=Alloalcanivorax marinus TaxID=1177169 RepID=UPI001959F77B|nr:hypothetical protein [Alloalcanivorax marinus]MBM7335224.1 hypothetical protein [Alloalcanivorax marinus]
MLPAAAKHFLVEPAETPKAMHDFVHVVERIFNEASSDWDSVTQGRFTQPCACWTM